MRLEEWNKYIETEFLDEDDIDSNSVSKPLTTAELAEKPLAESSGAKRDGETSSSEIGVLNNQIVSEISVGELSETASNSQVAADESDYDESVLVEEEQNIVSINSNFAPDEVTYSINPLKPVPPTFDIFTAQMSTLTLVKKKSETGETVAVLPETTQLPETDSTPQTSLFAAESDLIGEYSRPTANPAFYPSLLKYLPSNHPVVLRSELKDASDKPLSSPIDIYIPLQPEHITVKTFVNGQNETIKEDGSSIRYLRMLEQMKVEPHGWDSSEIEVSQSKYDLIERLLNPSLTIEETALLLNLSPFDAQVLFNDCGILEFNQHNTPSTNLIDTGNIRPLIRLSDVLALLETSTYKSAEG